MKDPYEVLEVARDADPADIKKVYRALAKKLHPDVNPDNKAVEQRFKEVSAAYDILSDPEKRGQFDRGEIGADGAARHRGPFRSQRGGGGFGGFDFGGAGVNVEDLFADLFGRGRRPTARQQARPKGRNLTYTLRISFVDAMRGGRQRVALHSGKTLDVNLPPGATDGQKLRLKGQGMRGGAGAAAGDAFVELLVDSHPYMRRDGLDIHLDLPTTLGEAVLGAKIKVPTIDGVVSASVPKGSNTGTVLRLKGRGILAPKGGRRGDQYVRLHIVLPDAPDRKLSEFLENWPGGDYDVRKKAGFE